MPLADKYRPTNFDEMVGQQNLIGPNGVLRKMINDNNVPSLIFYGTPGCGKTTAALILAENANKKLYKLNAVNASVTDIKNIAKNAKNEPAILYLDEIQYFNKKQQQSLLPYLEDGSITLIAATTENPYHNVYDSVLSRCNILEFKRIPNDDVYEFLEKIGKEEKFITKFETEALKFIAQSSSGDIRRALNAVELSLSQYNGLPITKHSVTNLQPTASMSGFDTDGDVHYQLLSALQKSIRGSDPSASVFYLSKLLEGGDIISPCRRLLVIACEDIGLACPDAISIVYSCTQAAKQLGLPEAYKPLVHATLFLATARKSSTNENSCFPAIDDIKNGLGATIPHHLRNLPSSKYLYPHNYPNHWVEQQYLPDDLINRKYYIPGDNPYEQSMAAHWWDVIHNKK